MASETFLVLQAARFGDLVQTKRLILSLQRRGDVHLLVDRSLASLAGLLYPGVTVHPFHFHARLSSGILSENSRTMHTLRRIPCTEVYNCNYSRLTTVLCRLFDCEIIGYRPHLSSDGGICKAPLLRLATEMTKSRCNACLNLVDLWSHLVPDPLPASDVNPVPEPGGRGIGVVLQGREERRSLPPALLAEIIQVFVASRSLKNIYLFGTDAEKPRAYQLRRALNVHLLPMLTDLTGRTDWAALMDSLRGLDALLTPDTGTMHLAAHLGVPVYAFFLSSALCHETGPYGQGHHIFQAVQPCSPCLESAPCPDSVRCLTPFLERSFLRTLSRLAQEKTPEDIPAGLQYLTSSLDTLGCRFDVLCGDDPHSGKRAFNRRFLMEFLGLTAPSALPEDRTLLASYILDRDWMLPRERYL